MNKRLPPAPDHLTDSLAFWNQTVADFALEPHHLELLRLLCEALDRGHEARRSIAEHGTTYTDRFGQVKPRPEVAIERDSRVSAARLLRELALDVTADESRPPEIGHAVRQRYPRAI